MRIKPSSIILLLLFACSCTAETGKRVPNVSETVDLYIDQLENHYFDGTWKKENSSKIYHPDGNYLGVRVKYDAIKKSIEDIKGDFLFSKVEVEETKSDFIWINHSKPEGTKESTYFILLKYTVIAKRVDKSLVFLQKPQEISQYVILANDDSDNIIKIIDFYPSIENRNFIGIPYVLKMPDKFKFSDEELSTLRKLYLMNK